MDYQRLAFLDEEVKSLVTACQPSSSGFYVSFPFLTIIGQGLTVDWLSKERIRVTWIDFLSLAVNRPSRRFLSVGSS